VKNIDYIIVGFGIAGAALALQLRKRGKKVMVFDQPFENQASRVAAGLFNPVTGKLMTKTWNADKLFPYLHKFYREAEELTGAKFFYPMPICIPFANALEQNNFMIKEGLQEYIEEIYTSRRFGDMIYDDFGGVILKNSGYIDTTKYLESVGVLLASEGSYEQHDFQHDDLSVHDDEVLYKSYVAKAIVFCEGTKVLSNPYFGWVPIRPLKGETIDIQLRRETPHIFNRGVYVVPAPSSPTLAAQYPGITYKVGATYSHDISEGSTLAGKNELKEKLLGLFRTNFRMGHQTWGIRPTTPDRRPVAGNHPDHRNLLIFNGLGTKGVSLAPFYSEALSDHILGGPIIEREVNISRFYALYSKFRD
jgi:glycine/D-amino acid oxidase-like deaminating enzyme